MAGFYLDLRDWIDADLLAELEAAAEGEGCESFEVFAGCLEEGLGKGPNPEGFALL
jgi:hypothetical protein